MDNITALYVDAGFIAIWLALGSFLLWFFGEGIMIQTLVSRLNSQDDCIVLHTYALRRRDGKIPARGKAAAKAAVRWAVGQNIPIIIPTGFASRQKRTDAAIYEEYMRSVMPPEAYIRFLHGENPNASTTHDEVVEAARIMQVHGFRWPVVIGIQAHLMRIHKWWSRRAWHIAPKFYGVPCGAKNYPWELANHFLEDVLPPGTKRREVVLALARRGPP